MRIGIDLLGMQHPDSRGRGIGRYVEALVEALHALDSTHQFELIRHEQLPQDLFSWERERPVAGSSSARWASETISDIGQLTRFGRDRYDVILLTLPFSRFTLPRAGRNSPRIACILYDLIPFLFPERYLANREAGEHYYDSLQTLKSYDRLLAISDSARADCEKLLGLRPGVAVNISTGGQPDLFFPAGDRRSDQAGHALLNELGIHSPYVFNVGGGDSRKNMEGLVHAFGMLPERVRKTHQLVITCKLDEPTAGMLKIIADIYGVRNRLVVTDGVSDTTLLTLYQHATLFVFPSEYEGFGLPILEAMLCGVPVIAGNNSSQPEVVGDAGILVNSTDLNALSLEIGRMLGDETLRRNMAERGLAQARAFTWKAVAGNTLDAFEKLADRPVTIRTRRAQAPKPRIAVFSPMPPKASGIADYAASLIASLNEHYAVDIYHDDGYVPNAALADREVRAYNFNLFPARTTAIDYAGILYQMGNNARYHEFIYRMMAHYPGVVTLHDFFLGDYFFNAAKRASDRSIVDRELLEIRSEGLRALLRRKLDLAKDPLPFTDELRQHGQYLNRGVFNRASSVVVHEQWNAAKAVEIDPSWAEQVRVIPFGVSRRESLSPRQRTELRIRYGLPAESLVVGSFGIVAPSKLNNEALKAFRILAEVNRDAIFVFAGPTFINLQAVATSLGLGSRVRILGRIPLDDFEALAQCADIGINLRRPPTNGETSAGLFSLLGAGVPTIVTNVDTFAGYPDDVVVKVDWNDRFEESLAREMLTLARDSRRRERIGAAAAAHIRRNHDWGRVAALYAQAIEESRGRVVRNPGVGLDRRAA